ncbi:hypothetical protein C0995_000893 [Termitomyces sp. Mi166|nr:hypothetical protein C0995_000893 [Termitomyces sp. Mi166\
MSNIASVSPIRHSIAPYSPKSPKYALKRPEVHVTTEHITMAEFPSPSSSDSPYSKNRTSSVDLGLARDLEGHLEKSEKESFVFPQPV